MKLTDKIKKIDIPTIIAITLIICMLFFWNTIFSSKTSNINKELTKPSEVQINKEISQPIAIIEKNTNNINSNNQYFQTTKTIKNQLLELKHKNSNIIATIDPINGCLDSIKLINISTQDQKNIIILKNKFEQIAKALYVNERNENWQLINFSSIIKDGAIILKRNFKRKNNDYFTLTQKFTLNSSNTIQYNFIIQNTGKTTLNIPEINIWLGNILSSQDESYEWSNKDLHVIDTYINNKNSILKPSKQKSFINNKNEQSKHLRWIATSNKYFANIIAPNDIINNEFQGHINILSKIDNHSIISSAGKIKNIIIKPKENFQKQYKYFVGPKSLSLLNDFDKYTNSITHLSIYTLETLSNIILKILIFFNYYLKNYGTSIILFIFIIRILSTPLIRKADKTKKNMSLLQPQIKLLQNKYKNDPIFLRKKIRELYREKNINPFISILPGVITIIISLIMFSIIRNAIEFRQATFLWINNLSVPDNAITILNFPINIIAILATLAMFIEQKLTPMIDDAQSKVTSILMPFIFLIFTYKLLPAGLTLYIAVERILGILQLLYDKYFITNKSTKDNILNNNTS